MWQFCLGLLLGIAGLPFYKWITKKVTKEEPAQMSYGRSLADAEKKSDNALLIGLTAAQLLFFLCNYVIANDLKSFMQAASTFWNVVGVVLHIGSLGFLWYKAKGTDGHGNAGDMGGEIVAWAVLLVLAVCSSTGFNFDYFSLR